LLECIVELVYGPVAGILSISILIVNFVVKLVNSCYYNIGIQSRPSVNCEWSG
jgi:hypothetical protein